MFLKLVDLIYPLLSLESPIQSSYSKNNFNLV